MVVLADKLAAYAPGLEVTARRVLGPSPLADRVLRGIERPVSSVEDPRHASSDELQPSSPTTHSLSMKQGALSARARKRRYVASPPQHAHIAADDRGLLVSCSVDRPRRCYQEVTEALQELGVYGAPPDVKDDSGAVDAGSAPPSTRRRPERHDVAAPDASQALETHLQHLRATPRDRWKAAVTGARGTLFLRWPAQALEAPSLTVQRLFHAIRQSGHPPLPSCECVAPVDTVCKATPEHVRRLATTFMEQRLASASDAGVRFAIRFRARNNNAVHAHQFIEALAGGAQSLLQSGRARVDLTAPDVVFLVYVIRQWCFIGAAPRSLFDQSSRTLNVQACRRAYRQRMTPALPADADAAAAATTKVPRAASSYAPPAPEEPQRSAAKT